MESDQKDQITEDKRLWIGNLDPRITEYQLLKLVQKYGAIEKFDLLFHRTGPLAGQPRGYGFVTYVNKEDAIRAKEVLNNCLVGQRNILVTWAHSVNNNDDIEKIKSDLKIPALAMTKSEKKTDRESKIQAIEAKLKLMERISEEELKINETVATKPAVITQFQYNNNNNNNNNSSRQISVANNSNLKYRKIEKNNKPYSRIYNKPKNQR